MAQRAKEEDLGTLKKMIEWFDGYAACYNADPFKIERIVNRMEKKNEKDEIVKAWSEIRQDVSDIITLPDSSDEIVLTQRSLGKYRPLSAAMVFATGLAVLIFAGLHLGLTRVNLLESLGVLLVLYALLIAQWYRGSRKLYRMVREYYNNYGNRLSRQRGHVKSQAQKLIDLLTVSIRTNKYDPEKYKMKLLHNDYSNIRVLSESTPKNMDRPVYIVAVKARSQP